VIHHWHNFCKQVAAAAAAAVAYDHADDANDNARKRDVYHAYQTFLRSSGFCFAHCQLLCRQAPPAARLYTTLKIKTKSLTLSRFSGLKFAPYVDTSASLNNIV
jgi:hypothetical protein